MLISTAELATHVEDPEWVIFDCRHDLANHDRGRAQYDQGHIPGAFFAPVETALSGRKTGQNGRHPLPDRDELAEFFSAHGVTVSSQIVGYDDVGGMYAARLWWLARWIGLSRVALLNGGINQWQRDGRPLVQDRPVPRRGGVRPGPSTLGAVWTADQVRQQLGDPASLVIDARAAERFRGEVEPIDPVAGHIPGAANRFYRANLEPDLTFRPAEALRAEFQELLQGRETRAVAHQCGSGITACANLFAMEYAGLSGSALYAGSWSEWVADPTRPVERLG